MTKNADHNSTDCTGKVKYTKKELEDVALNFNHFLYRLWIEWRKREIMKMDKTICNNEEPTNVN